MSDEVIILGAGSSKSYGFPTGDELLKIIINGSIKLKPDMQDYYDNDEINEIHKFNKYYTQCINFYKKKYTYDDNKFRSDLKTSSTKTIDTYLSNSNNVDDEAFAKFAISSIISFYENIEQMRKDSHDGWMEYLFNQRISYQLKDFLDSPPTIITFNYDTFFEHKLIKHLEKEHSYKDADSYILDKQFIKHVYGNLNNSSYKEHTYEVKEYIQGDKIIRLEVNEIDFDKIEENSRNINFIRAEAEETSKIEEIRNIIKNSKKIYILGYGFDKFNNEILFKNEEFFINDHREVFFTGFGLENSLKKALNSFPTIKTPKKENNMKCLELLKQAMPHKLFP